MPNFLSKSSLPRGAGALPLPDFFAGVFAGGGSCAKTAPATASAAVPRIRKLRFTVPPAFRRWKLIACMIPIPFSMFSDQLPSTRSEEHTSELQSHLNLVCRLLLEKKKNNNQV